MTAFDDVETATLGKAYERSWDSVVRGGGLEVFNVDTAQHIIASRIIKLAQAGERDERRIARRALQHFHVVRDEQIARRARYRAATPKAPAVAA